MYRHVNTLYVPDTDRWVDKCKCTRYLILLSNMCFIELSVQEMG